MLLIAIRRRVGSAASRPAFLAFESSEGPRDGALPVRILYVVVRQQVLALVNRCLRNGDLDVGADRYPEAIRLGHDKFDHPDFDAVRRLDNSMEPERSQTDDVEPCVR